MSTDILKFSILEDLMWGKCKVNVIKMMKENNKKEEREEEEVRYSGTLCLLKIACKN